MKNQHAIFRFTIALLFAISRFNGYAQQTSATQTINYQLDVKQSKILWQVPKNKHYGFLLFNSGSLNATAPGKPTGGTFSMNMNSMRSTDHKLQKDNQEIDDLLRSDGYFAIAKYPTATMVVLNIAPTNNPVQFKVSGNLTIKSSTNPIFFIANIKTVNKDMRITANLKIDRMKWHITGETEHFIFSIKENLQDAFIADEIPITLNLVFHQI
ncbi:MAG: YceI family protein [Mucilaginibacter sp.]|uniref:YceI family protein n=1 Tax=Mucilaginibacter sp. TaxID=1882438 RepID=UPI003263F539